MLQLVKCILCGCAVWDGWVQKKFQRPLRVPTADIYMQLLNIQFHLNLPFLTLPLTDVDDSCSDWGWIYELPPATVRKSDPRPSDSTIHTENLSAGHKNICIDWGGSYANSGSGIFYGQRCKFWGDQPPPVSSWQAGVRSHQTASFYTGTSH